MTYFVGDGALGVPWADVGISYYNIKKPLNRVAFILFIFIIKCRSKLISAFLAGLST